MSGYSFAGLWWVFARIGNMTFGGGDPTIVALYAELVEARKWLARETFGLVYALARVTPGTNMLAFCAGSAWELAGWRGAVAAVAGITVPSTVVVVLLTAGYEGFRENAHAMAAIGGALAAAVGMMAAGAWQLLRPYWKAGGRARAVVLAGGALALSQWLSPVAVLAMAAAAGWFWREEAK